MKIPPVVHKLGLPLDQPPPERVEIVNESFARISRTDWELLPRYDHSIPTGVYEGKMWRCDNLFCWFAPSPDPGKCRLYTRVAIVEDRP